MSSLVNLIYGSSAKNPAMSQSELLEILNKAREKNHRLGVTGMLLYRSGNFLQVLEGDQKVVEDLFETIKADPRHYNVQLYMTRPVPERGFGEWEMGFTNLDSVDPASIPGYSDYLKEPLDSDRFKDASFAYAFLRIFKEDMR